jgi:hypothetical protein
VRNKPSRVEALTAEIDMYVQEQKLSRAGTESLRGKLRYATSQTFGRCGGLALNLLGRHLDARVAWSDNAAIALTWFRAFLNQAAPRLVKPQTRFGHAVIFTDAACEDDGARVTAGAVLWRPNQANLEFLSYEVPGHIATSWRTGASGQVIGQAEIHPVVVAKNTWAHYLKDTSAIFLIDNDSARDALIKGYSPSLSSCRIIAESSAADARLALAPWYERVPSYCNIADAPSRGDYGALFAVGARQVPPVLPANWA